MSLLSILLPNYNNLPGFIKNYYQLASQQDYDKKSVKFMVSDDSNNCAIKDFYKINLSANNQYSYDGGPKLGAVANWNKCISKTESRYSMFIHHDEYIASEYFLRDITKILKGDKYDLVILPLLKTRNGRNYGHYPKCLKWLFIKYPLLLFACNPFGSPSVIIYRNEMTENFDKNLRWMVDVEWYYKLLRKQPKVLLLDDKQFLIISDFNFTDTETNNMDVPNILPREKKYLREKHNIPFYVFSWVFKFLRIPVKIYEYFSV